MFNNFLKKLLVKKAKFVLRKKTTPSQGLQKLNWTENSQSIGVPINHLLQLNSSFERKKRMVKQEFKPI